MTPVSGEEPTGAAASSEVTPRVLSRESVPRAATGGGGGEIEPVGRVLADWLSRHEKEVVARLYASLDAKVIAYRGLAEGGDQAAVVETLGQAARSLAEVLATGCGLASSDGQWLQDAGANRAERGAALEDVTAGVDTVVAAAWQCVMGAAVELSRARDVVAELGDVSLAYFRFAAQASTALSNGFTQRQSELVADAALISRALLDEVLSGRLVDHERLETAAHGAGVELRPPFGLLVRAFGPRGGDAATVGSRRSLVGPFDDAKGWLVAVQDRHAVAVVPAADPVVWEQVVETQHRRAAELGEVVVAARPVLEVGALAAEYVTAVRVLDVCAVLPAGVARLESLLLERLLVSCPGAAREEFVAATIGPLLKLTFTRRDPLLDCLRVMRDDDGSHAGAAAALQVNRRTVGNRLDRIQTLTGLSPYRPGDRLLLDLAVALLDTTLLTTSVPRKLSKRAKFGRQSPPLWP